MPSYTIKNIMNNTQEEIVCSWQDLQSLLESDSNLIQKLSTPVIVGSVSGNRSSRVPDGFKDLLKNKVKKGSGKGNTVNV